MVLGYISIHLKLRKHCNFVVKQTRYLPFLLYENLTQTLYPLETVKFLKVLRILCILFCLNFYVLPNFFTFFFLFFLFFFLAYTCKFERHCCDPVALIASRGISSIRSMLFILASTNWPGYSASTMNASQFWISSNEILQPSLVARRPITRFLRFSIIVSPRPLTNPLSDRARSYKANLIAHGNQ